jgi:hypothetical protein
MGSRPGSTVSPCWSLLPVLGVPASWRDRLPGPRLRRRCRRWEGESLTPRRQDAKGEGGTEARARARVRARARAQHRPAAGHGTPGTRRVPRQQEQESERHTAARTPADEPPPRSRSCSSSCSWSCSCSVPSSASMRPGAAISPSHRPGRLRRRWDIRRGEREREQEQEWEWEDIQAFSLPLSPWRLCVLA